MGIEGRAVSLHDWLTVIIVIDVFLGWGALVVVRKNREGRVVGRAEVMRDGVPEW